MDPPCGFTGPPKAPEGLPFLGGDPRGLLGHPLGALWDPEGLWSLTLILMAMSRLYARAFCEKKVNKFK